MDDTSFCQGILYTLLMEKVCKQSIPLNCKKKLRQLQRADVTSILKYNPDKYPSSYQEKAFPYLNQHFGQEELLALSWTMHYNTALFVHRWEKAGECVSTLMLRASTMSK